MAFMRIERIPVAVVSELVSVAGNAGIPVATAFETMLCGLDMPAAILAGELVSGALGNTETTYRGVHIDPKLRDAIVSAAKVVQRHYGATGKLGLGVAGGLILTGQRGQMSRALANGMRSRMEAAETPVAADSIESL